eukprot:scaffold325304_cov24-Attheya_sp.AAC.1
MKYFNQFRVRKENHYLWCDVILAHNESNKDFQMLWSDFLSSNWKLRLFPKKLQDAEQSASVYWILWTNDRADSEPLQTAISKLIYMDVEVSSKRVQDGTKYGEKR